MKAHEAYPSKFLRAPDLSEGDDEYKSVVVTITKIETSEAFDDGNVQRMLSFRELDKKLGLNKTNWNSVMRITKQDDDDHWIGHKIELWVDPDVMYEGKPRPSIRIRKPSFVQQLGPAAQLPPPDATSKASAWAAWKRAGATGTDADKDAFKKACDIEAANSKTPIDNFGAVNWANVADAYRAPHTGVAITEDDIPF